MAGRYMFAHARPFRAPAALAALAWTLAGCLDSSADHTIAEQRLARPAAIVVQDFVVSPGTSEPSSKAAESGDKKPAPGSAAEAERKFSDDVTANVVAAIREMDLPAVRATEALPATGSIVTLESSFVSVPWRRLGGVGHRQRRRGLAGCRARGRDL